MFSPYQRGIYCDDKSISYPYRRDTISHGGMAAVTITCSIVIVSANVLFVWAVLLRSDKNKSDKTLPKIFFTWKPFIMSLLSTPQITTGEAYLVHTKRLHSNSQFNQYLSALYKVVGTFLFGAAVSQSLTDLAKFTIGRPRPNFLTVCSPVNCNGYMLQINCTGNHRNVTESRWTLSHCPYKSLLAVWLTEDRRQQYICIQVADSSYLNWCWHFKSFKWTVFKPKIRLC